MSTRPSDAPGRPSEHGRSRRANDALLFAIVFPMLVELDARATMRIDDQPSP